jgi:RNA polymerase sigma-70 factor (ECF subfamily)
MARRDPLANPEQLLRRVYAYVAYRVGDRTEAEDITSETFERAIRYRNRFDQSRGDPIAWLLGIARNCVYDAQLRPRPEASEDSPVAATDVEGEVVGKVTIEQALATLSGTDRELLALRYGADLRAREIAQLLDQRTNAVEVALTRARARLADALERAEPRSQAGAADGVATNLVDGAL